MLPRPENCFIVAVTLPFYSFIDLAKSRRKNSIILWKKLFRSATCKSWSGRLSTDTSRRLLPVILRTLIELDVGIKSNYPSNNWHPCNTLYRPNKEIRDHCNTLCVTENYQDTLHTFVEYISRVRMPSNTRNNTNVDERCVRVMYEVRSLFYALICARMIKHAGKLMGCTRITLGNKAELRCRRATSIAAF